MWLEKRIWTETSRLFYVIFLVCSVTQEVTFIFTIDNHYGSTGVHNKVHYWYSLWRSFRSNITRQKVVGRTPPQNPPTFYVRKTHMLRFKTSNYGLFQSNYNTILILPLLLIMPKFNSRFGDFVDRIYPIEREIKDTTDTYRSASYLDLHLEIDSEGLLRTKLYDKRDDFNFPIVNIPAAPEYEMYISLSWYGITEVVVPSRGRSRYREKHMFNVTHGGSVISVLSIQGRSSLYTKTQLRTHKKIS